MGRLYVAEPSPTPTGTLADHRLAIRAGRIATLAAAIAAEVAATGHPLASGLQPIASLDGALAKRPNTEAEWVRAVAGDLVRRAGASVVVVGDSQPLATHVFGHLINVALGNLGKSVKLVDPIVLDPLGPTIEDLARALAEGSADAVLFVDCNPVATAAPELDMAALLAHVPVSLAAGTVRNETSAACRFSVPLRHPLEAWRDDRGHDGTITLGQPLIRPLHGGLELTEIKNRLGPDQKDPRSAHQRLLTRYRGDWRESVRSGLVSGSAFSPITLAVALSEIARAAITEATTSGSEDAGLEVNLRPSSSLYDGRFAGSPWLQELPQPVTKATLIELGATKVVNGGMP